MTLFMHYRINSIPMSDMEEANYLEARNKGLQLQGLF